MWTTSIFFAKVLWTAYTRVCASCQRAAWFARHADIHGHPSGGLPTGVVMQVQPYLFFEGRCDEAVDFYKKILGAKVNMRMTFKENPEADKASPGCQPGAGTEDKVMHMEFQIGDSVIMASDGRCSYQPNFQGFGLSINYPDKAAVEKAFNGLKEGGQVVMPLDKTFFADQFGMVTDRFGIMWMLLTAPK
jgi:PhnB protein